MKLFRKRMLSHWGIPATAQLMRELELLADADIAAGCAVQALRTGEFMSPNGDREPLGQVKVPIEQAALIAWLAGNCETRLSMEAGLGMGMTASIILAARVRAGHDFDHVVFDPKGLRNGRGSVVRELLNEQFGDRFQWVRKKSQLGIAGLVSAGPVERSEFILLDGDHHFDGVLSDFFLADQVLNQGGFMVLDDAGFPAIESLVQFIIHNRSDYEVSMLEIPNTAVLRKVSADERGWEHFVPFSVSPRKNWTPVA